MLYVRYSETETGSGPSVAALESIHILLHDQSYLATHAGDRKASNLQICCNSPMKGSSKVLSLRKIKIIMETILCALSRYFC